MQQYTALLETTARSIDPSAEDYEARLLAAASMFRRLDEGLDEFITTHGYRGDVTDADAKAAFLRERFRAASVPVPRGIKDWFLKHKRFERSTAFQLCFAFGLDVEQTNDFFRRVYLERGLDCHSVSEAVYFFCMNHGLSYADAVRLTKRIPKGPKTRIGRDADVLYTGAITEQLRRISDGDELAAYITANIDGFGYNNATATRYARELWDSIAREGGLAYGEALLMNEPVTHEDAYVTVTEKSDSVWDVYSQILGLDSYQVSKLAAYAERSIKPVLVGNALLHPLAEASFPDRDGITKLLNGEHLSHERVRKLLILLAFYRYWAKQAVKHQSLFHAADDIDAGRCLASINRLLLDSGYPELYLGNPYDWIFLWAVKDDYPLMTFRSFMGELFAVKSEEQAAINEDAERR